MQRTLIAGFALASLLAGSQGFAQGEPKGTIDGRSLDTPGQQQRANDAMNTPSGRAGRDEPGVHAQTTNEPVLKDGKIISPSTPTGSGTAAPTPDPTVGQRP